ncbi:hypothetical protein TeGR_g4761, partial [Tetraparma gracilis]
MTPLLSNLDPSGLDSDPGNDMAEGGAALASMLPPLNLPSLQTPLNSLAPHNDFRGMLRPHTSQSVRQRRRSMSDLSLRKQCDYNELVKSMGLKVPASRKASMDAVGEGTAAAGTAAAGTAAAGTAAAGTAAAGTGAAGTQGGGAEQASEKEASKEAGALALPDLKKDAAAERQRAKEKKRQLTISLGPETRKQHLLYDKMAQGPNVTATEAASGESLRSPTARYVTQTQNLNIVPTTIIGRVVESVEGPSVEGSGRVNLAGSAVGDDMAAALAHAMSILIVTAVDVSGNHMSDAGVCALLDALDPHFLTDLNISHVKVKKKVFEELSKYLFETSTLQRLLMEECGVDDLCLRSLCPSLKTVMCPSSGAPLHNCTLVTLNLSHNKIGDNGATTLAEALGANESITELDLSYNQIRTRGGVALFEVLNLTSVSVLDLARNTMGDAKLAAAVGGCLEVNDTLIHLSLAYTGLLKEHCKLIGGKLKFNHSLMGLHMEGNELDIDAHGYMNGDGAEGPADAAAPRRAKTADKANYVFTRIMPWANPRVAGTGHKWHDVGDGKCWICHRWNETRFEFTQAGYSKVMLCTNFDEWRSESMTKLPNGTFEIFRM